ELVERRLMGDRFEYHDQVRSFIATMPLHHDSDELFDELHKLLVGVVGVRSYGVIVLDGTRRTFSLMRSHPDRLAAGSPEFDHSSPVFRLMETAKADYFAFNPEYARLGDSPVE